MTPDPIGALNHSNLYQYLFNNPYVYQDKNGEFAFAVPLLIWGAEVALPTISAYLTAMTYTAAAGVIAYAGYKYAEILKDQNRGAQNYNDYVLYSEVEEEEKPNQPGPRTEPKDLSEQLALEEAKAKPQNEQDEIMKGLIKDPRYPCNEWKKVDHVHEKPDGSKIDIHYWEHRLSGQKQEFKFKNPY